MREQIIQGIKLEAAHLKKIDSLNPYKLVAVVLNILYSLIVIIMSQNFLNAEISEQLQIALNGGYYLILAIKLIIQTATARRIGRKLTNLQKQKCPSVSIKVQSTSKELDMKTILIGDESFDNYWTILFGFFFIPSFILFQTMLFDKRIRITIFALIFSSHVILLVLLLSIEIYLKVHKRKQQPQEIKGQHGNNQTPKLIKINGYCCICLNQYNKNEGITIYCCCQNVIHSECIELWLQKYKNCPLCREILL